MLEVFPFFVANVFCDNKREQVDWFQTDRVVVVRIIVFQAGYNLSNPELQCFKSTIGSRSGISSAFRIAHQISRPFWKH